MLNVKRIFFVTAFSAAAFAGLPASAFILTRVNVMHTGLGTEGLADRGRCQINNLEKREMNMVDGNAIYQVTPIRLEDPGIPQAKNELQALADRVNGVQTPGFSGAPVVNYWVQGKGTEERKLLLCVQDGKVIAKDGSVEAQTLVKTLEKNCFSLGK